MVKKNGVWKVFSILGILLLVVLLCYFSVAMYFYFGKPNDIHSKLQVWNLMSNESVGEMYLEASFDIKELEKEIDESTSGIYGINVNEKGYVLTLADKVDEDKNYVLYSKSGNIYSGKVVFSESNFNLAIIKINEDVSLPYVNIGSTNQDSFNSTYIMVGSPLDEQNISKATKVKINEYAEGIYNTVDGLEVTGYVSENSVYFNCSNLTNFSQGALLDKKGNLIGLVVKNYSLLDDSSSTCYAIGVEFVDMVLDKIISLNGEMFESEFANCVNGFDMYELTYLLECALDKSANVKTVYFKDTWVTLSKSIENFYNDGNNGYYLMSDLSYKNSVIKANSVITSVSLNGRSYYIYAREDLFSIIYSLNTGDKITLTYTNLDTYTVANETFVI